MVYKDLDASNFPVKPQPHGSSPELFLVMYCGRLFYAHSLLSGFSHVSIRLEKGSDVQCLASPYVTMYGPV